jgi:phosphoribosylformylglycinamidine synthase
MLADYQILCIPGGFSYGDDIGAGVIFSRQLSGQLGEALGEFLQADKLLLGICNGFQVLLKAGILPGGESKWPPATGTKPQATLTWNDNGKYTTVWVRLQTGSSSSVFLRGIDEIDMPVAHAEGKVVARDAAELKRWQTDGQVAMTYCATSGVAASGDDDSVVLPFPENPNGSAGNVAGLSDASGRVLGLMPHPERFIHATQHPQWTRRNLTGEGDGLKLFRNAVEYFA